MARDVLRKVAGIAICSVIVLALLLGAGYLVEGKFSKRVYAESSQLVEEPAEEDIWQDDRSLLDDEWFKRNERALREEMRQLEEFMYRLFAEKIGQIGRAIPPEPGMAPDFFAPDMDIEEKAEEVIVRLDLPGMEKEQIEILLEDDSLVIRGERNIVTEAREEDTEGVSIRKRERRFGSFKRRVLLPSTAKRDRIEADYENGVLTITIPKEKVHPTRTKKIRIK